ncbi:hypothetical protein [Nocardia blacklockiae]|uniref:hypothetical protein n=1 Tax=Nocardia blacklockiae TaxID=480036 RepID=UPI001893376D|nr:hypothetical protein [Nocardia blacklockiae]MBF6176524.1 hypothetical protein [Nocardia blacklockiae]
MTNTEPQNPYSTAYYGSHLEQVRPMPTAMPTQVQVARVLALVLGALALTVVVVNIAIGESYTAGTYMGMSIPIFGAAIGSLFFGRAGRGARVTVMVFGAWMILLGLMEASNPDGPFVGGWLEIPAAIAIVVLLSMRVSGDWFRRPR